MIKTFSRRDLNAAFERLGQHVSFVQIGAMDGVTFDPIHPFVKARHWRGLLVEPIPDMFRELRKTYAGCRNLRFARMAIAGHDGTVRMSRIDPAAIAECGLSPGALGISTLMPNRGVMGGKYERLINATAENIRHYTRVLTVPCCRLETLLRRHQLRRIDLLVVDAEGADWMIVRQFPFDRYKPRLIYFEYDHLPDRERAACVKHLRTLGYHIRLDEVRNENLLAMRL
jgi:FkbM family methyltransferase